MENESIILKKRLRFALAAVFLLALYLTGLFQMVVSGNFFISYLPHEVFLCCVRTGFNMGYFLVIFPVLGYLATHLIIASWKADYAKDKLGRAIDYNLVNQSAGDAHFADPIEYEQVAQIRSAENAKGKILGQLSEDGSKCIDWKYAGIGSPHSLVAGTTGAGKTSMVIFNYCMQGVKQRHSLIITDPKGELYDTLAVYMEKQGYIVRRFDLIDPQKSDGWDCMKYLRGLGDNFRTESEVDTWVEAIITNISGGKDDVFSRGSKALLKALALYIVESKSLKDSERNVRKLNEMIRQQGIEYFDSIFNTGAEEIIPARNSYSTFKIGSPNLYGNICTHLATGIQNLQSNIIESLLCKDDIDIELPAKQPCAYFCRFSPTASTYRFVSALFFTLLYSKLASYADKQPNKKCTVPVDFVLDEFPSIGILPGWEEKMSVMRSANLSALMVVQSFQQIEDNYGTKAVTIRSNCGVVINIGTNDEVTNAWFIDRLGETSVKTYSKNNAGSESESIKGIKLMSGDQLYQICRDNIIIIFQGLPPIYARKFHYSLHPAYKELEIITEDDIPDFMDKEGRTAREIVRQQRMNKYLSEHSSLLAEPEKKPEVKRDAFDYPKDLYRLSDIKILSVLIRSDIAEKRHGRKKRQGVPEKKKDKTENVREKTNAPKPNESSEHKNFDSPCEKFKPCYFSPLDDLEEAEEAPACESIDHDIAEKEPEREEKKEPDILLSESAKNYKPRAPIPELEQKKKEEEPYERKIGLLGMTFSIDEPEDSKPKSASKKVQKATEERRPKGAAKTVLPPRK